MMEKFRLMSAMLSNEYADQNYMELSKIILPLASKSIAIEYDWIEYEISTRITMRF